MPATIVTHPTHLAVFQSAAGRLLKARQTARESADMAWLGVLLTSFSSIELDLLVAKGFLSRHDLGLLRRAGNSLGGKR